jgi:RND family efflux transporter MFP subunit
MKIRILIAVAIVMIGLSVVGMAAWRPKPRPAGVSAKEAPLMVTTTAKKQDLEITITETGSVEARKSTPVVPEISGRVQWACENGIVVAAGDPIVRLDPTDLQDQLADLVRRYDDAVRSQGQSQLEGSARMKEMQLRLQQAEESVTTFERQQQVALRKMEDSITFHEQELTHQKEDAAVKARLADKGLIAGTEVERDQAAVKAAEFALVREKTDYELAKSQAEADVGERRRQVTNTTRDMSRTRSWSERGVRMSGNEVENLQVQVARAREDLAKTTISAPVAGLVVLSSQGGWRGEAHLPRLGDWISQGREVANVVSLERMQVKLELDQTQITGVTMGQVAEIAIDALPGQVFKGKVSAIGQNARRRSVQGWSGMSANATFPVTVDLPPTGKALIRPGMRAGVRLVSRRIAGAVVVPSGCIFRRDGKSIVFAERDGRFVSAPVTTGATNGEYVEIKRGLRAGDRIALNDLGAPAGATKAKPKGARQ